MTTDELIEHWTRFHIAVEKLDRPRDRLRLILVRVLRARIEQHRCDTCGQFAEKVTLRRMLDGLFLAIQPTVTLHDCGCPYSKTVGF